MPTSHQQFLADATRKAAADLEAALLRLPEDKRAWSPMGKARAALDQVAECALLNGYVTVLIVHRALSDFDYEAFRRDKAALQQDPDATVSLLRDNAVKVAEAIRAVPEEDLDAEVPLPFFGAKPWPLSRIIAMPFWNMTYHEGQINYIASLLD